MNMINKTQERNNKSKMFEKDLKVYLDLLPICLTLTSMISFHTLV